MMNPAAVKYSWQGANADLEKELRFLQRHKRFYVVRKDFLLSVDDFFPTRDYVFPCRKRVECIEIAYLFSAAGTLSSETRGGRVRSANLVPGSRAVIHGSPTSYEMNAIFEITRERPVKMVTLHITPAGLSSLTGVPVHSLPANLYSGPLPSGENIADIFSDTTPQIQSAVFQILNCSLPGPAGKLFIEGKALELLALELDGASDHRGMSPAFRSAEVERLYLARRIMMDHMQDPPTLTELAREVGLNEKKIKTGFRTLFGTTVYGFLQTHRIETARGLMLSKGMGVSEAAWAVGYVNVSHFGAAFRKHLGVLPGDYLRNMRRREGCRK
jgi:AraC-like DNA-binding protein